MSLNFFKQDCQYPSIKEELFGLCDNHNSMKAFPDFENKELWIAEVINKNKLEIIFTAIDNCVLNDTDYENRGRCDCMLVTDHHLFLVELKNKRRKWISGALDQLESTIQILQENHDISKWKKKSVFASNKKKRFVEFRNSESTAFLRRTGFLLKIQTKIEFN